MQLTTVEANEEASKIVYSGHRICASHYIWYKSHSVGSAHGREDGRHHK
jgi:hypothetical protein